MKIVEKEMVDLGGRGAGTRTTATTSRAVSAPSRGAESDPARKTNGELGIDADFQAAEALLLLGRRGLMSRPDGTALLLLPIT